MLRETPDPKNYNEDDQQLVEWDVEQNKALRCWQMIGRQVSDPKAKNWSPIRTDFTFDGPIEVD